MAGSVQGLWERRIIHGRTCRRLRFAALVTAGSLGAWTAWACHWAQTGAAPRSEAFSWTVVAAVFATLAIIRLLLRLGWLQGWGERLRTFAKREHVYGVRRAFQIVATMAIAVFVVGIFGYGLASSRQSIAPDRLAVGFAALASCYSVIRFVSWHEFDAWNAARPWVPISVELATAAVASALSLVRLSQLDAFVLMLGAG